MELLRENRTMTFLLGHVCVLHNAAEKNSYLYVYDVINLSHLPKKMSSVFSSIFMNYSFEFSGHTDFVLFCPMLNCLTIYPSFFIVSS